MVWYIKLYISYFIYIFDYMVYRFPYDFGINADAATVHAENFSLCSLFEHGRWDITKTSAGAVVCTGTVLLRRWPRIAADAHPNVHRTVNT